MYGFKGRHKRPPPAPVNAALSYGYTLLFSRVWLSVFTAGLHPEVGMLHAEARRNPSLVLDLMEEFRVPVVDMIVLRAFVRAKLAPLQHFEDSHGGIYLNEPGRKVFIGLFEERLEQEVEHPLGIRRSYARMMDFQAQQLAAALEGKKPYRPFCLIGQA